MRSKAIPKKRGARAARRIRSSKNAPAPFEGRNASSRARRQWRLGLFVAGTLLASLVLSFGALLVWATLPGPGPDVPLRVVLTAEERHEDVADLLARRGLVSSARLFAIYWGRLAPNVQITPGPHVLRGGLSPRSLVQRLGRLPSRPAVRVILPEGSTHLQIGERLEASDVAMASDFRKSVLDSALLSELKIHGPSAEGYLFPATYELFVDADPAQIVRQMTRETRKRLGRMDARSGGGLARLAKDRGFTEHEVLTLASIVEREAAAPNERPLVASVFYNRLDDPSFRPLRMLQSDPTAAYGCALLGAELASCAGFTGKVSAEMLRDAKNLYNTYRHAGLPPGPIANPGEDAVLAVLQPARTDYLYFVADGRGRHRFSRSFEEHRRAVREPP